MRGLHSNPLQVERVRVIELRVDEILFK